MPGTTEFDVPMSTRDGVTLRADVHRPGPPGRYPVLLVRTPYGKRASERIEPAYFPDRGYIVVIQDVRGRGSSDGTFDPFTQEGSDGADAVAWAATLDGGNGEVGTLSQSYMGLAQYHLATHRPPALRAASPVSGPITFFHDCLYRNGVLELDWTVNWIGSLARGAVGPELNAEWDTWSSVPGARFAPLTREAVEHTPVLDWADRFAPGAPYLRDLLEHTTDDDYWAALDLRGRAGDIDVPMLHVSSWYDAFQYDTLTMYRNLRAGARTAHARENQRLIMGPWAHLLGYAKPETRGAGEADFGPEAAIELHAIQRDWFDHFFRGTALDGPRVRLFVLGENRWRDEDDWPLARRVETPLYLRAEGSLSWEPPADEEPDSYVSDPADPVPSLGGASLALPPGVFDQRPAEARDDVLVYTGEVLDEPLEITGNVTMTLHAASSAPDCDFVARLVDVHPDGYAWNVVDGVVRARFRGSTSEPSLIEPGRVYAYEIDLWATSIVVAAGHRLRVEIASSCFPRWIRNPQTGEEPVRATTFAPAHQQVFHDGARPSHLTLPVIPR